MITRFIGSASDLRNVTKLALIRSDSMLLEDNISDYTPNYSGYDFIALINKDYSDGNPTFRYTITSPIKFNAIVMYSIDLKPLGFTMLTQTIDTNEFTIERDGHIYKMDTISINLAFTIDKSGSAYIDIDLSDSSISYQYHISNTTKMHKRLFQKRVDYAMTYDSVSKESTDRSKFSRNLADSYINDNLYRYAGSLSWKDHQVKSIEFEKDHYLAPAYTTKEGGEYDLIQDSVIMSIRDQICMISYSKITGDIYTTLSNGESLVHNLRDILLIGSNFMVIEDGDELVLIKSEYLLSSDTTHEDWILNRIPRGRFKFTQDPHDRSLMIYTIDPRIGAKPISQKLSDIIDRLGLSDAMKLVVDIIAASEGLIIYKMKGSDDILIRNTAPSQIAMSTPQHLGTGEIPDTQSIDYQNGLYQPFKYPLGFNKIEIVSNKALLLGNWDPLGYCLKWKLLEFEPEEINGAKNHLNYRMKSYLLGSKNNWRKLDCISRRRCNPRELDVLMSLHEGRAWRIDDKISVL